MSTDIDPNPADVRAAPPLQLGSDLTIAYAALAREQLIDALSAETGDLLLDLSAVTEFDSSAIQLLLATERHLRAQGQALRLWRGSAAVNDALRTFGLAERFAPAPAPAAAPELG